MTQLEEILRKYQRAIDQIQHRPSPFLEKVKKSPLTANTVKMAAPIGINGGFGFGAEGLGTPKAGPQRYVQFEVDAVDMYVDIQISNKTVQLASTNAGAMINALDTEIKSSYASAKWNVGRALFGDGSGILATVSPLSTAGNTCTVSDTRMLIEGLTIDIYASGAAVGSTPALGARRIVGIDRGQNQITFDGAPATFGAGFITVQGSYGKELCGLGAIFSTAEGATLYGIEKDKNPWINPIVRDAEGVVDDLVIYGGVKEAKDYKGANIDLLMMGDETFLAYQSFIHQHSPTTIEKQRFVGGAVGYKVLVGSQEVVIVNERFVPADEAWGVDTSTFALVQTPWSFMAKDSGIFIPIADTSIYRALLASYGNLICSNPGGCIRFTNCVDSE